MPSYHTSGFEVLNELSKEKQISKKEKTSDVIEKCLRDDKECQKRYLSAFADCA